MDPIQRFKPIGNACNKRYRLIATIAVIILTSITQYATGGILKHALIDKNESTEPYNTSNNQFVTLIGTSFICNDFIKELYVTDDFRKKLNNTLTIQQVKIASYLTINGKYINSIEFRDGVEYSGNIAKHLGLLYDTEEEALAAAKNDTYLVSTDKKIYIIVNFEALKEQFKNKTIKNANLHITLSDNIFNINNSPTIASTISKLISKNSLYCCSKNGNDDNNGSEQFPFRTIKKALDVSTDSTTILLSRNSVFHESISLKNGIYLIPYGSGNRPIISGFAKIDSTTNYTRGIFNKDYSFEENEDGNIVRFDLASVRYNDKFLDQPKYNIGSLFSEKLNRVYGTKTMFCNKAEYEYNKGNRNIDNNIQRNTYLLNKYDFYQDTNNYRHLYIVLDNVDEFISSNIKISTYGNGIVMANNSEVTDIHVEGFGRHGIIPKSNCKVHRCRVSYIGGSIQPEYLTWVRLGNGIECWVSAPIENVEITDNIIEKTFDCALTIQGRVYKKTDYIRNIKIENNKSYQCRQLFEFFYNDPSNIIDMPKIENIDIRSNIGVSCGYQPFGPPEPRDAGILHYQNKDINGVSIEENVLIDSKSCLSCYAPSRLSINYNKFICQKGDILWSSPSSKLNLRLIDESDLTDLGYRYQSNYIGKLNNITNFEYSYHDSLDYCNERIIELFKTITNSPHLNIVITNDIDLYINV